jgi:hypothetical protein
MNEPDTTGTRPRYRWPWFVLAAFVAFVVLAIVWMSVAVHRARQQRDADPFSNRTTN